LSREFEKRGKKVHKMTRDGLVEKNLSTGEEQQISQRGQDFQLRRDSPPQGAGEALRPVSHGRTGRGQPRPGASEQPPGNTAYPDAPTSAGALPDTPTPDDYSSDAMPENGHETRYSEPGGVFQPDSTRRHNQRRQSMADNSYRPEPDTTMRPEAMRPPEYPAPGAPSDIPVEDEPRPSSAEPSPSAPDFDLPAKAAGPERPGRLHFADSTETAAPKGKHRQAASARQHGTKYQRGFTGDTAISEVTASAEQPKPPAADGASAPDTPLPDSPRRPAKPSRLQFTSDERPPGSDGGPSPDKKLSKLQGRAEKLDNRLERARDKLPSKVKRKRALVYDEQKQKAKRKIQFEKEVLPPHGERRAPLPARAGKAARGALTRTVSHQFHKKIYEVEQDNVGTQTAHRAELAAEGLVRGGKKVTRSAFNFARNRPYHTVEKLEKKAMQANVKFSYRKALAENPQLRSNVLSRFMQKRKIKQQYAKAYRDAKKAGQTVKKTGTVAGNAVKAVAGFIKRHPMIAVTVILILFVFFLFGTLFTSCSNMGLGGFSSIIGSSYTAEDADIDNAELSYTEWETDLQMRVNSAETDYPGYDEYRYSVDDIGHDPYELMAYLTAVYQDFTYSQIQAVLQEIFAEQYTLTFTPEVEIRTRTITVTDPETGEESEEEEEYEWHILNINLTARSFSDVIAPRMDAEQREMFGVYMETKGNRQYLVNVFDFNWLPLVTSNYGYRVHPISGAKDYHKGIDIGVPTGTDIMAGQDGRVTAAAFDSGGYGWYVVIEDDEGLVSKYAHCDSLLVSVGQEVKKGDVIAKSGNSGNSTGPHLHLEVIKNGQYLNPAYFAETGDDGSGRLPPGNPGGISFPEYPGEPMGDGDYAALMAEAQLHLGKPYVFGAKGPDKFDCSGFVSWALTHSGVKSISTNAQGLYNASTPVSPENAQPGDLIFFHSTYSTSNTVTHVGIYIGNGMMIHAGKPVQYASINTTYWQNHFYAFGRI